MNGHDRNAAYTLQVAYMNRFTRRFKSWERNYRESTFIAVAI
jgi:hypothetical protein